MTELRIAWSDWTIIVGMYCVMELVWEGDFSLDAPLHVSRVFGLEELEDRAVFLFPDVALVNEALRQSVPDGGGVNNSTKVSSTVICKYMPLF